MKRNCVICFLIALITVISFSAPAFSDAQEEFHQTYTVDEGTEVEVKNVNGNINITSWDEDYVDVYALKSTTRDRDELDRVSIDVTVNGIMLIETNMKRQTNNDDSFFSRLFSNVRINWPKVNVDFTIKLPKSAILTQTTITNGNIELEGTRGDTSVQSTNGQIEIYETDGYISAKITNGNIIIRDGATVNDAKSVNGSITATISDELIRDVDISTVNGGIDLYLPEDINADIDLKTVNGSISAGGFRMVVDSISKRHFTGTLGSGGETIHVSTINGSIELHKE